MNDIWMNLRRCADTVCIYGMNVTYMHAQATQTWVSQYPGNYARQYVQDLKRTDVYVIPTLMHQSQSCSDKTRPGADTVEVTVALPSSSSITLFCVNKLPS